MTFLPKESVMIHPGTLPLFEDPSPAQLPASKPDPNYGSGHKAGTEPNFGLGQNASAVTAKGPDRGRDKPGPEAGLGQPLRILLLDCRDSFTHNLAQAMEGLIDSHDRLEIVRHDALDPSQVAGRYDRIVLSPGPGLPTETANLMDLIAKAAGRVPILGVCLGHQALALAFGGRLVNLAQVRHGIQSNVKILAKTRVFEDLPDEIPAGRYHSWLVDSTSFPKDLLVTAIDESGQIMGLSHRRLDIHGVQFHPESILTPAGPSMLKNFLFNRLTARPKSPDPPGLFISQTPPGGPTSPLGLAKPEAPTSSPPAGQDAGE
ncbi:MAG: aminodeoxychorismate/anthranilate synthase component II [Deltaproteobacteria bacterium]|jgi:anthranilate synthase component 2|nr:aminodeoxychorismate/anthranilate synthase component II [Deltaproteobacteria bacterium]